MTRKVYDPGFRAGAIALAKEKGSVKDAAKELGVSESLIYKWKKDRPARRRVVHRAAASGPLKCPTCGGPVRLVSTAED